MKYPFLLYCILYLLTIQVTSITVWSQNKQLKFKRLSTDDGLSQGHVSAILKDHQGFMWFATDEGLNKYDGYRFTAYKNDPGKNNSLIDNLVFDVMEDAAGNLWVGTASGLDKLDRGKDAFTHFYPSNAVIVRDVFQDSRKRIWLGTTEGLYLFDAVRGTFKCYKHTHNDANSLSNDFIYRIAEDNEGELWIATKDGLNKFNPQTQTFSCYKNDPGNSRSIGGNWIKTVFKDHRGNIWAGTQGNGIALFDRQKNLFINFRHDPRNINSVCYNDILSFGEDNKGNLWIGTENGGISIYDYNANNFVSYKNDVNDNNSLSNNSVYSIYRDNIGNIWAGTWSGGVNFLPALKEKFEHYKQISGDKNSLSNNIVLSITGDSKGYIWIGTDGGGLNRFDRKTQTFIHFRNDIKNKNSISSDYVLSVIEVEPNVLGLGYQRGGFDLFNTKTGVFTHFKPLADNPGSVSVLTVNVIFKDAANNLWLGTWGGGLNLYDKKTNCFIHYQNNPADNTTISNNFIHSIYQDNYGNLWVATDGGLDLFDKKNNRFIHYKHEPQNWQSISHNMVEAMLQDMLGNFWIATGAGVNLFNYQKQSFTAYTEKDGLSNNSIRSILQDRHGNLWIGSNKGLTKFNAITKICRNYGVSDGLQSNEFKSRCSYKTPDGEMFFGGPNGFNAFYPDSIKDNCFIPPVYFTDFQVFNKPVVVGNIESPLHQHISETKEIRLSYKQSVFTFEFSALNYTLPEKNRYAYKMDGFDKEWNYVLEKRTATYTNLDAGEYVFHVKASNNDGIWNEKGAALRLVVTPPFWLTWWFKLGASFICIGTFIAFYLFRINSINAQKRKLQVQVREQTAQLIYSNEEERKARLEADQANEAKSVFLATMSHEIRTPMNGVIGMASLLKQTELTDTQAGYAETISTCGENLLTVINDILDFSKIESGKMELENIDFDLRNCIEEVLDVFAVKATGAGVDLICGIDHTVPTVIRGDSVRLRQILMNLVSNAVKFTHKGEIFVKVSLLNPSNTNHLELVFEIRDSGIGIPAEKMGRLFKAFSQVDSSTTRKYGGTGLGLIICEKLIALMGGHIDVKSIAGEGTTFTFTIHATAGVQSMSTPVHCNMGGLKGKHVLVVDDNATNLCIMKNQLEQWKLIPTLAGSGKEALNILSENTSFDLLLTDMQMPEMDGIELAEFVRKRYPQLPILLLSSIGDTRCKEYPGLFGSVLTKPIRQQALCKHILNEFQQTEMASKPNQPNSVTLSVDFARRYPMRLLLVEDNAINQQLMLKILSLVGYEPAMAENGKEAVEMTGKFQYDIVLMDVQMPEMDGLEATKIIRQNEQSQPIIIALTANAMQEDRDECKNAGMDDYLSKPVKLEDLVNTIEKWAIRIKNDTAPLVVIR
ncbi:MAG: two-component regulator propeller domain-containing protein [Chitinophagaceae bacterium]